MNPVKQFSHDDIQKGFDEENPFTFTCAMVSTCAPLFDRIGTNTDPDNHDVEKLLLAKKVIRGGATDSESCQLFVYFKTRKAGEAFIDRLNQFLVMLSLV
jgi:hypothetical protein